MMIRTIRKLMGNDMSRQQYFDLSIPAPHRLAMMRQDFAAHSTKYPNCPEIFKPIDWRKVRGYTHGSWQAAFCTLDQGAQDGTPIWYCHTGPQFRNERDAHEIIRNGHHKGWFTDTDCSETAIGIVGMLTHGRYIAGYRWTSNDERIYWPEVFTDENDAARRADEHARVFAENARDDSERFDAMRDAELAADDAEKTFRKEYALRHHSAGSMDDARDALQALREARETLFGATAHYEKGE